MRTELKRFLQASSVRGLVRPPLNTLNRAPSIAQRKTAVGLSAIAPPASNLKTGPAQPRRQPVAPPVYRPQPTPKVLQTKTSLARQQTQPAVKPNNPARTSAHNSHVNNASRFVVAGGPRAISSVAQPKLRTTAAAMSVRAPHSVPPPSLPNQKQKTFLRGSAIQCAMEDDSWKKIESQKDEWRKAITTWLESSRARQFALASPGVIAYIVEVAIEEANLDSAKRRADEILSAVAQIEQHVPLVVDDPDIAAIPARLIEGISQSEHLQKAQEAIEACAFLTKRIAEVEANVFANRQRIRNPEEVFPSTVEGAKAFALDRAYRFGNASRNQRAEDYSYILRIPLTRTLKDYLIKHLWINVYKINGKNFETNPQIKFENKGYTVIIPKKAWRAFWERVETFKIDKVTGEPYKTTKDFHDAMHKEWHHRQMALYNQLEPMTETPSYIN